MLHKWRVYYQQNKLKIWKILGIIVLCFILLQILNHFIKQKNKQQREQENNFVDNENTYISSSPSISGGSVNVTQAKKNEEIIDTFISYCNQKNPEEAYKLVSNQCKEIMFPKVSDFIQNYYQPIFTGIKTYDLENWINYGNVTYKIKLQEDIMATGKTSNEYIEDYYTVITENNEKRLNINRFVKKESIGNKKEKEEIEIQILNRYVYIDDEKYEIKFSNSSDENVIIDTKQKTESVYLKDTNGVRYSWYGHDIQDEELQLEAGEQKILTIGYNRLYNPKRKNKSLVFSDIQKEGKEKKIEIEIGL